ncbi:hypothetical protein EDD53_1775 [Pacificibacter maritimus]|uniref:DUF2322 family protein n=1 Tax=Pacificibacter maritimus TaxID=762213 RepID=A0A3N4UC22_9RHOB|nr:DUF2322 family protein [Pacificibacter maritimus]RPE67368.1 hypothetical protein EDD53_1775 [Pacificibacter maritimus]
MIQPTTSFKDNLSQMPPVDGILRIDLVNAADEITATIENVQGKQGSLVVYNYLSQNFDTLDAAAATHGLAVFGEHTEDAKNRPGAHPNIDRLFEIVSGAEALTIRIITA